jgi:hypothetical protein
MTRRMKPLRTWMPARAQTVFHTVSTGYFGAMGMRLVEGRWLTDHESEPVAIVNELFARRVFGDANPIGRRIRTGPAA